jgi:ribosomal protein L24E
MAKKTFITQETRNNSGKFQKVSDIVMENVGIERMGTCSACGHEIESHVGVYHQSTGYMYVGKDCAKILTSENKEMIVPENGTQYEMNGKNQVVVSEDFVKSIGDKIYKTEQPVHDKYFGTHYATFENGYAGGWYNMTYHNQFTSNVFSQVSESKKHDGFYHMSVKQYEAIKKALSI